MEIEDGGEGGRAEIGGGVGRKVVGILTSD
jgi:hypothetical protein